MTTIQRVSSAQVHELQYKPLSVDQLQARIRLFSGDQMERPRALNVGKQTIALPASDPQQQAAVASLLSGLTDEQKAALVQTGNQLFQGLASSPAGLTAGSAAPPELKALVTQTIQSYSETTGEQNADAAVQGSMYMAVASADADVYDFAAKLKGNLDEKKAIREEIADFRDQMADAKYDGPGGTSTFTIKDENGNEKQVTMTKEQAEAHMGNLESKLQTASDMTQEMQMQLQDAMNKQAQAIQLLSNIMKMFHDTAKAIIGNMRA
jgi:hypothetical protein